MTIDRKTRDRRGGHRVSPIINREGVVHVDPGMKRFLKRDQAKQLRRQMQEVVEQEMLYFRQEHEQRMAEQDFLDSHFDDYYFDELFRDYLNDDLEHDLIEDSCHFDDFDPLPYEYDLDYV